jgi:hypothetical protein
MLLLGVCVLVAATWSAAADSAETPRLVQLSSGFDYTCGVLSSGRLSCWQYGGIFDGLKYPSSGIGSMKVPSGTYTQVEARNDDPCAVRADGRVICWKRRPGNPIARLPPGRYKRIAGFYSGTCGIRNDGRLRCSKIINNIGSPTTVGSEAPAGRYTQLGIGAQFGCALSVEGLIRCWGYANDPPSGRFREIDAQSAHACAITLSWKLRWWSREGPSDYNEAYEPVPSGSFRHVSVGGGHTCALTLTGEARCWGANNELRQASPPPGRFTAISASFDYTCAITTAGRPRCWGKQQP